VQPHKKQRAREKEMQQLKLQQEKDQQQKEDDVQVQQKQDEKHQHEDERLQKDDHQQKEDDDVSPVFTFFYLNYRMLILPRNFRTQYVISSSCIVGIQCNDHFISRKVCILPFYTITV